jgi:hypothetical protein
MTTLLTRAEVEALPDLGPWHVAQCVEHSPEGRHFSADYPPASCLTVRSQDGRPVREKRGLGLVLDLQAAAPDLRATALALYNEVERHRAQLDAIDAAIVLTAPTAKIRVWMTYLSEIHFRDMEEIVFLRKQVDYLGGSSLPALKEKT